MLRVCPKYKNIEFTGHQEGFRCKPSRLSATKLHKEQILDKWLVNKDPQHRQNMAWEIQVNGMDLDSIQLKQNM